MFVLKKPKRRLINPSSDRCPKCRSSPKRLNQKKFCRRDYGSATNYHSIWICVLYEVFKKIVGFCLLSNTSFPFKSSVSWTISGCSSIRLSLKIKKTPETVCKTCLEGALFLPLTGFFLALVETWSGRRTYNPSSWKFLEKKGNPEAFETYICANFKRRLATILWIDLLISSPTRNENKIYQACKFTSLAVKSWRLVGRGTPSSWRACWRREWEAVEASCTCGSSLQLSPASVRGSRSDAAFCYSVSYIPNHQSIFFDKKTIIKYMGKLESTIHRLDDALEIIMRVIIHTYLCLCTHDVYVCIKEMLIRTVIYSTLALPNDVNEREIAKGERQEERGREKNRVNKKTIKRKRDMEQIHPRQVSGVHHAKKLRIMYSSSDYAWDKAAFSLKLKSIPEQSREELRGSEILSGAFCSQCIITGLHMMCV